MEAVSGPFLLIDEAVGAGFAPLMQSCGLPEVRGRGFEDDAVESMALIRCAGAVPFDGVTFFDSLGKTRSTSRVRWRRRGGGWVGAVFAPSMSSRRPRAAVAEAAKAVGVAGGRRARG
jgi:hypothetical protein